ncbi:MAG: DNRLRE domain-containing protein [Methanothrix sp.]|nr:DNRLRE domain-containing protein [Methanothrix sp.]
MRNYSMKALMVLACIGLLAGCAVGVKISPALQMDTYTDAENADQSFGEDGVIWVTSQSGQPVKIAYLSFAGMSTLPQQISSASLKMYVREIKRPGKVSMYLYDNSAMDTITWEDQPEYDPEALGTLDIQETGWQTWDATDFVKKAAVECSEGCPFSVVLIAEGDASISFASMEGSAEEKASLQYEAS